MRTQLYQWLKTNGVMLLNAGSLIGTTLVTGVLGLAYWWVAARQFPPQAVGLASAAISAMMFLGAICVLGLGTLLIGELPRQTGKEASLISAALILVAGVGVCGGIVFALVAPFVSADFRTFRASPGDLLLFAAGVSLTTITIVLDQALIGLLRGSLQFWRNSLFSLAKLVLLFLAGFWLLKVGPTIYGAWAGGNLISLLPLAGLVVWKKARSLRTCMPDWELLRKLRLPALEHHMLNLILQAPLTALPVLVTILLSATTNAWFYVSWMLSGLVFIASYALTTVLYALNSAQSAELTRKIRLTLTLALVTSLLANCVLQFGATMILGLFGHIYAEQAAGCLRILGLAAFPMIIKHHYIAVSRIHSKMARAALPVAIGSILELGIAGLGAHFGGLVGLSSGWVAAVCLEAVFMFPAVYRAAFPGGKLSTEAGEANFGFLLDRQGPPESIAKLPPVKQRPLVKGVRCTHCSAIMPVSAEICRTCGEELEKSVIVWPIISLLREVAVVLLPLFAAALWSLSLPSVHIQRMTDLGLVSVLPATTIIALFILALSFCVALNQQRPRAPVLLLHVLLLIVMLYSITTLVEQAPRFAIVYRHAGYTDFIMRTGSVDPGLDAYFSWPGFFIFSAFLTQIAGYHDILAYAAWASLFLNFIYLGPLYAIFSAATSDKRIVWLALWFFYVTNWIWQDYFSPQGLDFFMYLLIIAILLKWFKKSATTRQQTRQWRRLSRLPPLVSRLYGWLTTPELVLTPVQPGRRRVLLASILVIFAFIVFSHPLTPFMTIVSVAVLVIFGRCTPRWLPLVMVVMTAAWIIFMAQAYLIGNLNGILNDIGQLGSSVTANVTTRVQGNADHTIISEIRLIMTLFIWGLAFLGAVRRLRRGYRGATFVLLAFAPFPLLFVQSYGGEMLLRIYLFTLPPMVFFAAALFYSTPARSTSLWKKAGYGLAFLAQEERSASARSPSRWVKALTGVVCIVLLGSFLFTRYGNERADYITNAELAGVRHLYSIAPPGSLLMAGWEGTPWEFQNYEKYNHEVLGDDFPAAIADRNVAAIVRFIESVQPPTAYLIITRSQKALSEALGLPPGALDRLEGALLASGRFVVVYSNADTQILLYSSGVSLPGKTHKGG